MKKFIWIPLALLGLAACADDEIDIKTVPVTVDVPQAADPLPVRMLPVQWIVVTKDNVNDVMSKMSSQAAGGNYVFLAISTNDYKNISLNLADLGRYIEQQKAVIVYYRNITATPSNK